MSLKTTKKIISIVSFALVLCLAFAGCVPTGTPADGAAAGTASTTAGTIQFALSMVVLFAVFYFFMIRPENKKKKKIEEMRSGLSMGDEIVTIGGIKGKIVNISGDSVTFETGEDRVRIQVAKWAISSKGK
ncbi:MAG: preprotein translocase subunit YajC [Clostridiales bacterium]|jgi:preprotein translocase subunit YajC|nr:preprotein translocase subunit YajC [Clostridiales bacterium]